MLAVTQPKSCFQGNICPKVTKEGCCPDPDKKSGDLGQCNVKIRSMFPGVSEESKALTKPHCFSHLYSGAKINRSIFYACSRLCPTAVALSLFWDKRDEMNR